MKDSLNVINLLNLKSRVAGIATGTVAGGYLGYLGYGAIKASLAATTTVAAEATTGIVGTVIAAATANPVAAAAIGVAVALLVALGVYHALKRKNSGTTPEAKETANTDETGLLDSLIKPSFAASLAAFAGSALAGIALGGSLVIGFGASFLGIQLLFSGAVSPFVSSGLIVGGLLIPYLGSLLFVGINKLSFSLNLSMFMSKINKAQAKIIDAVKQKGLMPEDVEKENQTVFKNNTF